MKLRVNSKGRYLPLLNLTLELRISNILLNFRFSLWITDFHIEGSGELDEDRHPNSHIPKEQSLVDAYKKDPYNHVWIFILYFFEYAIITGFFDRLAQLRHSHESPYFLEKNLFTVTQFLYQLGVLIARSSLYCFYTKKTGIITISLGVLFILFFYFCLFYVEVSRFIILFLALALGLLGGWGYLFSYFRLMDHSHITKDNKEKLINYLAVCADQGAFFATGFATVVAATILKIE